MAGYEGGRLFLDLPALLRGLRGPLLADRPGEAVFVVGGHEALGAWKDDYALPLQTSAELFPKWQTVKPVRSLWATMWSISSWCRRKTEEGQVQWQNFQGNYRVCPVADEVLLAASDWEKASAEVSSLGPASSRP